MPASEDVNVDDLRRRARRRLVGAIVLALAAAVLVPMLLESEPKPLGEDVSVRIPPVDDAKFVNKLNEKAKDAPRPAPAKAEPKAPDAAADAKAAPKSEPETPPKSEPVAVAEPPKAEAAPAEAPKSEPKAEPKAEPAKAEPARADSANGAPKPDAAPKADKAPEPKAVPKTDAKPAPDKNAAAAPHDAASGFSVQLAAFSDNYGANALSNKLKKLGYPAYTEPLQTSRGTLYRVRVGPFASREAAAASRDKLKGEGYAGIVAPSK
ncbi:MAG: SPOR domain-containing protein [Burkholderiales bacterium]